MATEHHPRVLVLFFALSALCFESSFGADTRGLQAALQAAGLRTSEIHQIISKVNRGYPESYVKDHIHWLQKLGLTSSEQLTRTLPIALSFPIQGDLEEKVIWLKAQGVRKIGDLISFYPQALGIPLETSMKPMRVWLDRHGMKDTGKFFESYPQALMLSPEKDKLDLKLAELRNYWGIAPQEVEKYPFLLGSDLQRIQKLRLYLDGIAKLAGDSHFELKALSSEQRRALIQNGSSQQIFESLKEVKAIDRKRESLSRLTVSERKTVVDLYRARHFEDLLAFKHHEVALHVNELKKPAPAHNDDLEAYLKDEGFAYIERQQIITESKIRHTAYSSENIKNCVNWLKKQGVRTTEGLTKALLVVPRYKIDKDLEPTVLWFKDQKIKNIGSILGTYPQILTYPIEGDLRPKLQWLHSVGVKDVPKLIQDSPQLLTLSLEENLKPTFEWLDRQGVAEVTKLLTSYPQVFGQSIQNNLGPKIEWLKSLNVDIEKLTKYHPAALTYSLKDNLKPTALWLNEHGVADVGKLINSFPAIVGYSIKTNLEPKTNWLIEQKFKDPGKLISSFPAIFSYSIEENLTPKLTEFKTHWGIGISELEEAPMLMGASLSRVQSVRLFLDELAKIAGDSHFNLASLPDQQRRVAIMTLSAEQIFERLKEVGAISAERKTLADLTTHERSIVAGLYREHALFYKLFAPGKTISSLSNRRISCYIDFLKKNLPTQ